MSDEEIEVESSPEAAPPAEASPKRGKAGAKPKAAKQLIGDKKVAGHPSSAVMVLEAVSTLADKGGSSLQAIKKYIAENHTVDIEKQNTNIKKALRKLVETGKLIQPKGKGAAGSFKLPPKAKPEKKPAEEKVPRANETGSPVKKAKKPVKPKASPKPKAAAKPKVTAKPKAATKPKKEPKPKTAESPKKDVSPKKKVPAKPKAPKPAAKPVAEKKAKKPVAPKSPKMKLPKTLKQPAAPSPKPKKQAPKKK